MIKTTITTLHILVATKAVDLFLFCWLIFLFWQEELHANIIRRNGGCWVGSWAIVGRLAKLFPSFSYSRLLGHFALFNAKVSHQLDFFSINVGDFGDCFGVVSDLNLSIRDILRLVFHLGDPWWFHLVGFGWRHDYGFWLVEHRTWKSQIRCNFSQFEANKRATESHQRGSRWREIELWLAMVAPQQKATYSISDFF